MMYDFYYVVKYTRIKASWSTKIQKTEKRQSLFCLVYFEDQLVQTAVCADCDRRRVAQDH